MYPAPEEINPAVPDFSTMFGIVSVIVILGFVVAIAVGIRNAAKAAQRGQNPLTVEYDLALKALSSDALKPAESTEQKLAELDRLFAANLITADEREAARARVLGSL